LRLLSLVDRLRDPSVYPHPVGRVVVHETHISHVFLAGAFAYKIKKPVRFDFLDFSTPAKRKYFCEEEVRLNRRFVEDLYLGVVPLFAGDAKSPFEPAPGEEAKDFAVHMRRFDSSHRLDALLAAGDLTGEILDDLAGYLARMHAAAPVASPREAFGAAAGVLRPLRNSIEEIETVRTRRPDLSAPEGLPAWVAAASRSFGCVLSDRLGEGFVRECHGDLHLSNCFLASTDDGLRVRAYDCIEFDPALRWIDVMSDAAFPFMDLLVRGETAFAYRFLDRYLAATGDYAGLQVLRLYVVYRSLVRSKVAALQRDAGANEDDLERYHRHLELARTWTDPPRPTLAITTGVSGTGKSTLAAALVERLPAIRIRSDVERRRDFEDAPDRYSAAVSGEVYRHLAHLARGILAAGHSVVVDAAFLTRASRHRFERLADDAGVPFRSIWCRAPVETLEARVRRREAEGRDPSEAGVEVLKRQRVVAEDPGDDEAAHTISVDTTEPPSWDRFARELRP